MVSAQSAPLCWPPLPFLLTSASLRFYFFNRSVVYKSCAQALPSGEIQAKTNYRMLTSLLSLLHFRLEAFICLRDSNSFI